MSTEAGEPRTEVGRALLRAWLRHEAENEPLPANRDALIAAIEAEAGPLDAAWAACEAALPEGWELHIGASNGAAAAHANDPASSRAFEFSGAGPTPTAALTALTLALRDKAAGR